MKVAVIGTGNMGRHHARVYSEIDSCDLVAIADPDPGKSSLAEKLGCRHYTDYMEMLEKEDIDACTIAVPTSMHADVGMRVLEKGIHVLMEKPLASRLDEGEKLLSLAEQKGLVMAVGHIEVFNPVIRKLKDVLARDKIGRPLSVVVKRVGIYPPQIKDANVILDLGVHDISVCKYLLDEDPELVSAVGGRGITDRVDYGELMIRYGTSNAIVQVNWLTPVKIREVAVTGTKGYAFANYLTQELKIYETVDPDGFERFDDFVRQLGRPVVSTVEVDVKEPLREEIEEFLSAIKEKRQPLVNGREGLIALKIALQASEKIQDSQ